MAKGDGWAVKRYVCPNCKRKGLYYNKLPHTVGGNGFYCMYKSTRRTTCDFKTSQPLSDIIKVNPELETEKPRWKN